jgi:hypothetical protein
MMIEGLEHLRLENREFHWHDRIHPYEDIASIRFHAQRKLEYTFLPTGSTYGADLALDMTDGTVIRFESEGRAVFSNEEQNKRVAAIRQAKEILSEKSFAVRIAAFEDAVRERGCFKYGTCKFYKDGEVFRDGYKICSIKEPGFTMRSSPFQLHLCPPRSGLSKLFGHRIVIPTTADEDCLYYMLRHVYGYECESREIGTKKSPIIDPEQHTGD